MAIQEAARKSLTKLLRPLSAFALDCGLSIREVNLILRTALVQSAAARQLENSDCVNISGISALTGIPRGEVSRILNSSAGLTAGTAQGRQNITNRILSAWHSDPRYLTAGRRPRNLRIFGDGPTFESLVGAHGRGIPIRAILDELERVGAIQLLTSSQVILPKMPIAINPRITYKKIRDLDAATDNLFLCLSSPSDAAFDKVSSSKVLSGRAPLVRKKSGSNASALLREVQNRLAPRKVKHSLKSRRNLHRNR